ncbi:MAG TPA: SAM-dependent methyltransferase [Spirochaetia bacterium]|nr:SAM-dependent methyltransferase [Spirochaetia bacterium]
MAFHYEQVVPWGRSYEEYVGMFGLTDLDLKKRIIGCGDGPAAFNCRLSRAGGRVVSVDPLYAWETRAIRARIRETADSVIAQTRHNLEKFIWSRIKDVEDLKRIRLEAMEVFLSDFEAGKADGRYVPAALPHVPFTDDSFDLALSSHFLFLYSENLSLDFHMNAIDEMLRMAGEVRIFPLVDVNTRRSPHIPDILARYHKAGYYVREIDVDLQFQKGATTMLCIKK